MEYSDLYWGGKQFLKKKDVCREQNGQSAIGEGQANFVSHTGFSKEK